MAVHNITIFGNTMMNSTMHLFIHVITTYFLQDYPHMLANAQADRNGPESSTRNPHSNIDIHTYEETTRNPHSNIDPPQAPLIQVKLNVGRLMQLLLNKV